MQKGRHEQSMAENQPLSKFNEISPAHSQWLQPSQNEIFTGLTPQLSILNVYLSYLFYFYKQ